MLLYTLKSLINKESVLIMKFKVKKEKKNQFLSLKWD